MWAVSLETSIFVHTGYDKRYGFLLKYIKKTRLLGRCVHLSRLVYHMMSHLGVIMI